MKGLFIKDGYMIRKQGRFFLIFNILYAVLGAVTGSFIFCVLFNVMLNCMMVKTLMAYEEQNNWNSLCVSLPVTAEQIVWEKYIVGFCCALGANLLSFAVLIVARTLGKTVMQFPLLPLFLLYVAVSLFYLALELPVLFRFGTAEGRVWFIMVTSLAAGAGAGTGSLILTGIQEVRQMPQGMLVGAMVVLTVLAAAAVYISGKISIRIYKKKEL